MGCFDFCSLNVHEDSDVRLSCGEFYLFCSFEFV